VQPAERTRHHLAARRVVTAAFAGAVAAGASSFVAPWQVAVTVGWLVTAVAFLGRVWSVLVRFDADATAGHATRLDDSRVAADAAVLASCLASLVAVVLLLAKSHAGGTGKGLSAAMGVASVVLAWAVVHTVFTLRYGHLYYEDKPGGIDFPGDEAPTYRDFAYLAFTIGMTYQVSDTELSSHRVRMTALRHSLLSYVFGTAIIALTINLVAGLV